MHTLHYTNTTLTTQKNQHRKINWRRIKSQRHRCGGPVCFVPKQQSPGLATATEKERKEVQQGFYMGRKFLSILCWHIICAQLFKHKHANL